MAIRLISSYGTGPLWLRGNLHAHTTNSDGPLSPRETVLRYADLGYDFLMLSDHDQCTDIAPVHPCGMVLIRGNEISANGPHMLHVDPESTISPRADRQGVLASIINDGGFAIVCHPNWEARFNHCPQSLLETWLGYSGLEIYNGVVARIEGSAYATDRWDQLLSQGRRVWGYANDDCHDPSDIGCAWNVVRAEAKDRDTIVAALRHGSFYASTGVTITDIRVEDRRVTIETEDAECISVYTQSQRRLLSVDRATIRFQCPEDFPWDYFRFECYGRGERRAWTQPFFIER